MKEVFKSVKGYKGLYEVSNTGKLKRLEKTIINSAGEFKTYGTKIMKGAVQSKGGFISHLLSNNEGKKLINIHLLVAEAFMNYDKSFDKSQVINHIDGNKANNKVDNLEITTISEIALNNNKVKSSKFKGVSYKKSINKWISQITINGKQTFLGAFQDELQASAVYIKKSKELIRLNK